MPNGFVLPTATSLGGFVLLLLVASSILFLTSKSPLATWESAMAVVFSLSFTCAFPVVIVCVFVLVPPVTLANLRPTATSFRPSIVLAGLTCISYRRRTTTK